MNTFAFAAIESLLILTNVAGCVLSLLSGNILAACIYASGAAVIAGFLAYVLLRWRRVNE
jgi:hypothetical protein